MAHVLDKKMLQVGASLLQGIQHLSVRAPAVKGARKDHLSLG